MNDLNWYPESLGNLAANIQKLDKYNLSSRQFKPRIIAVFTTGTAKLKQELSEGLDSFYNKIASITDPTEMWKFVNDFSTSINQVGHALICDFLKEIGFARYVKVDHHFKKQFPQLVFSKKSCRDNPKQSFILSQEIADAVNITPYHLDFILYLWGRYGSNISSRV